MTALVNGQMVYAGPLLAQYPDPPPHQFGIGSRNWWAGQPVEFSSVRVRKLTKKPEGLDHIAPWTVVDQIAGRAWRTIM